MRSLQKAFLSLFKKKEIFNPDKQIKEYHESLAKIKAGWRIYPSNATPAQKEIAIELFLETGECQWYPPEAVDIPYVVESTLKEK